MMSYETIVSIMNRLVENGVSFKKAYYGIFGDNVEAFICVRLYNTGNANEKLQSMLLKHAN